LGALFNPVLSASVPQNTADLVFHETDLINGQPINEVFKFTNFYGIESEEDDEPGNSTKPSTALSWGAGCASGLAITLCSVCGVFLTPLTKKSWYKKLLLYLIAAATASLLGNSLFQLLPPAFDVEVNKSNELNIWKAATAYLSFVFFFIIERVLNIVFGGDDEDDKSDTHSEKRSRRNSRLSVNPARGRAGSTLAGTAIANAVNPGEAPVADVHVGDENLTILEKMKKVKMFAWMLFIGDAMENVADGMAMGAGFGQSIALGIGITIAIFSEEFPHKIGDFAIFLNAGMSVTMALVVNVISGATVWIGIVIGLIFSDNDDVTMFIFAIAGGVFLYVGLGGLFPEMGEVSEELQEEGESPWTTLLIELAGLATGLVLMLLLCYFSEDIEHAFE
jgi:zinc transporter ZupT